MCCNRAMPLDPGELAAVGTDLARLAELLRVAELRLPGLGSDRFAAERDEVLRTIDTYLRPRIAAPESPLVAAIVGASGVGKSTLLNSLAQAPIAPTGVVRPTTQRPTVWGDSSHSEGFWLAFSARLTRHLGVAIDPALAADHLTEHLTVIDTPPLGRPGTASVANQAVSLSDLCIFVTTPGRYADSLAWDFLKRSRRRAVPILFVLNRLPPDLERQDAILGDFARRLHQRELLAAPDPSLLFGIAEGEVDRQLEALSSDAVGTVRKELAEISDPVYRQGLVDETVYATARMIVERARALTRPMAAEQTVAHDLLGAVARCYENEASDLDEQVSRGLLGPAVVGEDWSEAANDVAGIVTRRAGAAAHAAAAFWGRRPESAALVDVAGPDLWRHGSTTSNAVKLALDSWRSGLEAMVTTHARPGRLRWFGSHDRATELLWRTALSGWRTLPRRLARKFTKGGRGLLATARAELSEALRSSLATDAERFTRYLGTAGAPNDPYAAIVDRAVLLDARLDALAEEFAVPPGEEAEEGEPAIAADGGPVVAIRISEGSTAEVLGGDAIYHRIEPPSAGDEAISQSEAVLGESP